MEPKLFWWVGQAEKKIILMKNFILFFLNNHLHKSGLRNLSKIKYFSKFFWALFGGSGRKGETIFSFHLALSYTSCQHLSLMLTVHFKNHHFYNRHVWISAQKQSHSRRLQDALLNDYDVRVRPTLNESAPTDVGIAFVLYRIESLVSIVTFFSFWSDFYWTWSRERQVW